MRKNLLVLWNWYTHWFVPAAVLVLVMGAVIGGGSWYWDRTHLSDSELREIVTVAAEEFFAVVAEGDISHILTETLNDELEHASLRRGEPRVTAGPVGVDSQAANFFFLVDPPDNSEPSACVKVTRVVDQIFRAAPTDDSECAFSKPVLR